MARQKLGGTKSYRRGKCGQLIYRCKRCADGSLSSTSYQVPQHHANNNTYAQVKSRMIMGQIERMFHVLPAIIKNAWVNIDRGSLSFQYFAKLNYPLLQNDYDYHYEICNEFDWRPKYNLSAPAGPWKLTEGDIPPLRYDKLRFAEIINNAISVDIDDILDDCTVGSLLSYMGLKRGDQLIFFLFRQDEPYEEPYIMQILFSVPINLNLDQLVKDTYENEIIVPNIDTFSGSFFHLEYHNFSIYYADENSPVNYRCSCFAPLIIRNQDNKQHFSSAQFTWGRAVVYETYIRRSPADVITSWQAVNQ